MDPESPFARVERTLMTVWGYITEVVNRFLRPPPDGNVTSQPDSSHEPAVECELPPDPSSTIGDSEKEALSTVSFLSSSQTIIWENCTTDVDLGPDGEDTELRRSNESNEPENDSGTGEDRQCERDLTEIEKLHICDESMTSEDSKERIIAASKPRFETTSNRMETLEEEADTSTLKLQARQSDNAALLEIQVKRAKTEEEVNKEEISKLRDGTPTVLVLEDVKANENATQQAPEITARSEMISEEREVGLKVIKKLDSISEDKPLPRGDQSETFEETCKVGVTATESPRNVAKKGMETPTEADKHAMRLEESEGTAMREVELEDTISEESVEGKTLKHRYEALTAETVENVEAGDGVIEQSCETEKLLEIRKEETKTALQVHEELSDTSKDEPLLRCDGDIEGAASERPRNYKNDEGMEPLDRATDTMGLKDNQKENSTMAEILVKDSKSEEEENQEHPGERENEPIVEILEDAPPPQKMFKFDKLSEMGVEETKIMLQVPEELAVVSEDGLLSRRQQSQTLGKMDKGATGLSESQINYAKGEGKEPFSEEVDAMRLEDNQKQEATTREILVKDSISEEDDTPGLAAKQKGSEPTVEGLENMLQKSYKIQKLSEMEMEQSEAGLQIIQKVDSMSENQSLFRIDQSETFEDNDKMGMSASESPGNATRKGMETLREAGTHRVGLEESDGTTMMELETAHTASEDGLEGKTIKHRDEALTAVVLENAGAGDDVIQQSCENQIPEELPDMSEDEPLSACDQSETPGDIDKRAAGTSESAASEEMLDGEADAIRLKDNQKEDSTTAEILVKGYISEEEENQEHPGKKENEPIAEILEDALQKRFKCEKLLATGIEETESGPQITKELSHGSEDELIVPAHELRGESDERRQEVGTVAIEEDKENPEEEKNSVLKQETRNSTLKDALCDENYLIQQNISFEEVRQRTEEEPCDSSDKEEDRDIKVMQAKYNFVSEEQVGEETFSCETVDKERCLEKGCPTISVTGKPKGETAGEINSEFKNTPLWIIEGQAAELHESSREACEETRGAVPEHNNELKSEENTTQRFVEGGNCKEIQIIHLPEEVGKTDEGSFKNISEGAECTLLRDLLDKKKENFDITFEDIAGSTEKSTVGAASQESGSLFKEIEVNLVDYSMKSEFKIQEFYADAADETTAEQQDACNSVNFAITGVLPRDKEPAVDDSASMGAMFDDGTSVLQVMEAKKASEKSLSQKFVQVTKFPEQIRDCGFSNSLTEITSSLDKTHTRLDFEENYFTNKEVKCNETLLAGTAPNFIPGQNDKEFSLNTDSEVSLHPHIIQEKIGEHLMNEEIFELYNASKTVGHLGELGETKTSLQPEEKSSEESVGEVIDEGLLDLWMEAAMSMDTDYMRKDPPEPTQIKDQTIDETGEDLSEKDKGLLLQSNLEEPEPVSDTGTSITMESFCDPHLSQPLACIHDTLTAISEDSLDFSLVSQSILFEKTSETSHQREDAVSCPDSGVSSPEDKCSRQNWQDSREQSPDTDVMVKPEGFTWRQTEDTKEGDELIIHDGALKVTDDLEPPQDKRTKVVTESAPEPWKTEVTEEQTAGPDHRTEVDAPLLDFAVQRSRISVKNPRVRPPTDPRTLIHMPSAEPTPSSTVPVKLPAGVPLGGLGLGIKLPGIGSGFPVLKKTQQSVVVEHDHSKDEDKEKEKQQSDSNKQEDAAQKPKWKPPGHPGFGNPLMSELRTKLKKTSKE